MVDNAAIRNPSIKQTKRVAADDILSADFDLEPQVASWDAAVRAI
jgi:hypothetical protein